MVLINIGKAKAITHNKRREARANEFAPLDAQININIVNSIKVAEIETDRQAIRGKYAAIQTNIDACTSADDLKSIIETL